MFFNFNILEPSVINDYIKSNNDIFINRDYNNHTALNFSDIWNLSDISKDLITTIDIDTFDFELYYKKNKKFIISLKCNYDTNYWIKHFKKIPKNLIYALKNNCGKLILDDIMEGTTKNLGGLLYHINFFERLHEIFNELEIPENNIIFLNSDMLVEDSYNRWFNKQNKYKNIIVFSYYSYGITRVISDYKNGDIKFIDSIELIEYKKINLEQQKIFTRLNRTFKNDRLVIQLFLEKKKLIDKTIISHLIWEDRNIKNNIFNSFINQNKENNIDFLDIETEKKYNDRFPIFADDNDAKIYKEGETPSYYISHRFSSDIYKDAFISIVASSFPHRDDCHLHESLFRPMFSLMPIILYGPYHGLMELRKHGFKTFSKWWDEDYDNEKNNFIRLYKMLCVVEKIGKLGNDELLDMYIDMIPTLEHNREVMLKYNGLSNIIKKL